MLGLNYNYAAPKGVPAESVPLGYKKPRAAGRITTVRLPEDTRRNLEFIAKVLKKSKTEVIVEAINMYYEKEDNELDSYTLGLPFFPKESDPGIGPADLSVNHKKYYYEALREKHKRESEEFFEYAEELRKKKSLAKKRKEKIK